MAVDGGSVRYVIEADASSFNVTIDESVENLGRLEKAAKKADEVLGHGIGTKALQEFDKVSSKAGDAFDTFVKGTSRAVTSAQGLGSALKGIGLGVFTAAVGSATGALVNLAKKGIQATDFLETSRVAMAGLTGSMELGNKAMTEAAKYWQNNPFQRTDVTTATKQLVQFGRTVNDIPNDLKTLGNVSLSTGMNIAELARYYARVSASGRAMTMDLEMMSDRGVPVYRELEKLLGTTTAGVREMASKGKIDFETFRKAMEGAVNPEAMKAYEETLARQTDRLKGSISTLAGDLAGYKIINDELVISENGLEKAWTRLLKTLATGLRSEKLREGMQKLGEALAKVVDKITTMVEPALNVLGKVLNFVGDNSQLILPILGALAVSIGKIGSQIPLVSRAVNLLGGDKIGGIVSSVKQFIQLNPLLSATIGILGLGFFNAMKNSEEFKKTFSSIVQSVGTIAKNLMEALKGVGAVIWEIIQSLANSGVIQGILQGVANALAWIAQALASIPPEMLATLISFFLSLKLLKANPLYLLAAGIALVVSRIKELGGIGKVLEKIPETLATIGHNMMTGLVNGIQEGARKVFDFVKQVGQTIVNSFRQILGIHSPSTVMYGIGQNIGLGLANGIEDSKSAVQVAMNNLAKDILSVSEKVIKNQVDFGILDVKGEYKQWQKVSRLFTQGSEQYNYALEKMEDARKRANLEILSLQRSYNEALDESISHIANMYSLFDDVNLQAGKNSSQILSGLDQQIAKLSEWESAQDKISESGLDSRLIAELQEMGVDASTELSAIANMTADELSTLNNMWLKKQEIANRAGVKQMKGLKEDTLAQINDLKKNIDGTTVDVADVGGRLVENISEGIYGAMPTLENAFAQLGSYIEKAQKELAKSSRSETGDAGAGATEKLPDAGEEVAKTLKEEIENSVGKMKDMLPNIILGGIAAWGTVKFGPKILKAIARKLSGGTAFQQGLAGILFPDTGMKLTKESFSQLLGLIDIKRDGNFLSKAIGTLQEQLANGGSEVVEEVTETAKNMKKATQPAKVIAESSSTVGESLSVAGNGITTAGKGISKANSILNTIIKGAGAVIAIAGAIAAMAGALWLTYNALKDVDMGTLIGQLGLMAGVTAVFGTIANTIGQVPGKVLLKGIGAMLGICVEIAGLAASIRFAYEAMKPIAWEDFGKILGMMASALGTFGVLNGVLGIKPIAIAEGLGELVSAGIMLEIVGLSKSIREAYDTLKDVEWEGFEKSLKMMASALAVMGGLNGPLGLLVGLAALAWVSITMICDEMIKLSRALVEVDKNIPEDFGALEEKLKSIKKTIEIINGLDLGSVIGLVVTSWSAEPVERIIAMYVKVAEALNKIQGITLNREAIEANLDYIKSTLESIKAKSDIITGWLEASALDVEASSVENAGRIVTVYGDMVDSLNKLSNFSPDDKAISESLLAMVGVVTLLRNQSYGNGGIFTIFNDMGTVANDVEKIKSIVKNYVEMLPTIKDLAKNENVISDTTSQTVTSNIGKIKDIVLEIGSVDTGGWIDQKESDVQKIQSILNKFTELEPVIWQISQMNLGYMDDDKTGPKAKIQKIRELVLEIGKVDTGGWIDQKESDMNKIQSILNKFTEIAQTTHHFGKEGYSLAEGAIGYVQGVRDLVWEIGQINTSESGSLDAKAEVVEKSKTIAQKLGEFGQIVNEIKKTDNGGVIAELTQTLNSMLDGVSNSLAEKTSVFENIGTKIGQSVATGVNNQKAFVSEAGVGLQTSLWTGIEGKLEDEFKQGQALANMIGDGIKSVNFEGIGAGIQTSVWWGVQNRMQDEYYQGRTLGETLRQGMYDIDYANAGWWAVQGFINGVNNRGHNSGGDSVYWVGRNIAEAFLKGIKDRGEQGSPWKTTMQSGSWAVEGLIDGIKSQEGALINEATSLADQVVDVLSMDDVSVKPSFSGDIDNLAPNMSDSEYGIVGGNGRGVVVNQTNNNYTDYSIDAVNRDLSWMLSKV